ncbi:hypothetical protein HY061_03370 [Candidatus Azambacteria bacterium]|nr:hypothetical protein [Candidatus Azambacteria bacterium]
MSTITIPKNLIRDEFVVVEKAGLEKLAKENSEFRIQNSELKLAIKAILEGDLAFRQGKTRSFEDFLKSKSAKHVKNQ